jgi:diguanylate cyclase (GGDEF)-like protein
MADELTDRYEELNLVYDTNDDVTEYENEAEAFNQLLNNCVEHLDVALAALVFPEQDGTNYATGTKDPVQDPFNLIQKIYKPVYAWMQASKESLIINTLPDPLRLQLYLDIPYKIMAFPVVGSQGAVTGMLVCLNHMYCTDFYNSDKNLLEVVSRKVSKILQVKYDSLTGLMNLNAFKAVLEEAMASANSKGSIHSFLNIDLDQLRLINDSLGREAGDGAIRYVADILREKLRTTDAVGYFGEGHFGVLLEKSRMEQGLGVAENVRETIANKRFVWESEEVEVGVSIGMAMIEPNTRNTDVILEAAEIARDYAKESGRNRIQVYSHGDKDLTMRKERMQWMNRIQNALRDDRLQIYAQTIEPLAATSENYHFEILLRMLDEDGTVINPAEFIPPAESFNFMPTIDRWVINKTFSTLGKHGFAQSPSEGIVSINLSGQSLADERLVDYIGKKYKEYNLAPECTCFEITETSAIRNMESALYVMSALKEKGCYFSLDDFGTGLSSFSYLKDLPIDYLKIDGSFVRKILGDRISHAMVSSINQVGHVMGLKTIAEFVETVEVREQLKKISIDYVQGYYVCKPVPLEDYLLTFLENRSARTG